jgi:glycosyltransferase involved in cell wall biosynthesis
MRIVIDARLYGLENAGLGRYTQKLVENLQLVDHKNEYLLLLKSKHVKSISLANNFKAVQCNIPHYSVAEQIQLPKLLKRLNPDITHFPHFNVPYTYKGCYVVTIHDMLMHKFKGKETTTQPWYTYTLKRIGYKKIFEAALKNAHKIIVPSHYVKTDLERYFNLTPKRVEVTYEGVETQPKSKLKPDEVFKKYSINQPFFIYAGNAYPHKNLARGIEAIVHLNKQLNTPVIFVISTARNVFSDRIEKLVIQFGAQSYVKFAGFVPDNELGVLMHESVGFLYPSMEEGFGLQGLEAMINNTLVIASDIPVFREVYKDNALYFNPFDFTTIAAQLKTVVNMDVKKRNDRIKKASEFAEQYSWKKMAEQTRQIYEQVYAHHH